MEVYNRGGLTFEVIKSYQGDMYSINVKDHTHALIHQTHNHVGLELPSNELSVLALRDIDLLLQTLPWKDIEIDEITEKWSKGEIKGDPFLSIEQKNYIRGASLYGSHCKSCGSDEECDCYERDENDMGVDIDTWNLMHTNSEDKALDRELLDIHLDIDALKRDIKSSQDYTWHLQTKITDLEMQLLKTWFIGVILILLILIFK